MRNNLLPINPLGNLARLQPVLRDRQREVGIVVKAATEKIMAKKTDNTNKENSEKFQRRMAELALEGPLIPAPEGLSTPELIAHLEAEGLKLLAEEEKKNPAPAPVPIKRKDERKELDATLALNSTNPYVRARVMILQKLPAWKRKELEQMEKTGDINNKYYQQFVHDVRVLGDTLQ